MNLRSNNICCIFNLAAHYREPVYKLIDKELNCHFYIGDKVSTPIKLMKYDELKGFKKRLKYVPLISKVYWQKGSFFLIFKPYKHYIITGEPYCLSTWVILFFAKVVGKKTYLWTHGWYGRESKLKKLIKKIFFSFSNKVLLYGNYARNLMINEGFSPDKLVVIYNSLDHNRQLELRSKLKPSNIYFSNFRNTNPVIIYIGRIQKVKKIDLLIYTIKKLNDQKIFCNLVIIGGDSDKTKLKEQVNKLNLQNYVWFYGPCYEEEKLSKLIFNADVTVSPGNVGLTAIHSLTYGTPVITHDNFSEQGPEFEVIKRGLTGDFFKEDSLDDLVVKIKKWIILTEDKREIVRQDCYKIIDKNYTPENQVKIIKSLI